MTHARHGMTLCLALAAAGLSLPARANDCTSTTGSLVKVWDDFESVALKYGCTVAGGLLATPAAGAAAGAACNAAQPTIDKIRDDLVALYNNASGDNSGKLGPRAINFGIPAHGTLVSIGERVFVSPGSTTHDDVTVKLTRLDGDEKVKWTICRSEQKGGSTIAATRVLDGEAVKAPVVVKVTGMKGRILVVHLAAAKVNLKSFKYELVASED